MEDLPLGFQRIKVIEFYVGSFLDSEGNKLWFCPLFEEVASHQLPIGGVQWSVAWYREAES
jgi:hypothetical protein